MNNPEWNVLIPELKEWNNGTGIDAEGWVSCMGNFKLAAAYTLVFWPEFVEHEDMVLRKGFSLESLNAFLKQRNGDKSSVEAVMNHLHIVDIHYYGCPDATHEGLIYLGRVLKEIYQCKLRDQFPNRDIVVHFDDSRKEALLDYEITVFQKRSDSFSTSTIAE